MANNPQPETGTVLSAEDYETLEYQSRLHAEKRPCGARPCDEEFPGLPQRWCSGCLVKALRAQLAAAQADYLTLADAIHPERASKPNPEHWTPRNLALLAQAHRGDSLSLDETETNNVPGYPEWDNEKAALARQVKLTAAEATVARLREELTDWQLVADGVKHHFGCPNNATTGAQTLDEPCLRCQVESVREAARREAINAAIAVRPRFRPNDSALNEAYNRGLLEYQEALEARRDAPPEQP